MRIPAYHTRTSYFPSGRPDSSARPPAVRAKYGVSTTTMYALIWSWMLHPTVTTPGLSKTTGAAGVPAYSGSWNLLAGEKE